MIVHRRHQYAVGQGCFHAGLVALVADKDVELPNVPIAAHGIRYVYDCGALGPYAGVRDARVDAYIDDSGAERIDLLFISHLHEDHVSGLERLTHAVSGCPVDTVVLPLLGPIDRLISLARSADANPSLDNPFLDRLVVDPLEALRALRPRQIVVVRRGGEGGAAEGPDRAPDGDGPFGPAERGEGSGKWRLIGRGRCVRRSSDQSENLAHDAQVFEADDTLGFSISVEGALDAWLLQPYVDPEVGARRAAFITKCAELFGLSEDEFEAAAADPVWLMQTVKQDKATLAEAYASIASLNVTSLCLLSAPMDAATTGAATCQVGQSETWAITDRLGWLGTGDADLKTQSRRKAFLDHYSARFDQCRSWLLPHHGSERNFDPELVRRLRPELSIACAAPFAKWRHPGTSVVQAICDEGHWIWVVGAQIRSEVAESIFLPWPPPGSYGTSYRR